VAGSGELAVHRGDDTMGVLLPLKVTVDGNAVARLMLNQTVTLRVSAGDHIVRAGRSRPVNVPVPTDGTVHVLAGHPPVPSYWRSVFTPFRASRPTVAVIPGPAAVPGPGQRTAPQIELHRRFLAFVPFAVRDLIVSGCLLVAAGGWFGVVGRAEVVQLVIASAIVLLGILSVTAGVWLRRRVSSSSESAR
jgi:hypothetical protein